MDLSPEHLDRHPFRIRRRGYDIMQVRKLLREIGEEMRARQRVRDELPEETDPVARAEHEAATILARAETRADEILAEARLRSRSPGVAAPEPDEIVADARTEATRIIDEAEVVARDRSASVIAEAQLRLDGLIDKERDVAARLRVTELRLRELSDEEITAGGRDLVAQGRSAPGDAAEIIELNASDGTDRDSLATFMKHAVRGEIEAGSGS